MRKWKGRELRKWVRGGERKGDLKESLQRFQGAMDISNTWPSTNTFNFTLRFAVVGMMNLHKETKFLCTDSSFQQLCTQQCTNFYLLLDIEFCWLYCNWAKCLWLKLRKVFSFKAYSVLKHRLCTVPFQQSAPNPRKSGISILSGHAKRPNLGNVCAFVSGAAKKIQLHIFQFSLRFIVCHFLATAGCEVSLTRRALMGNEWRRRIKRKGG